MRQLSVILLFFLIVSALSANAQKPSKKKDPAGNWKFDAPYAPEGYTSGTISGNLTKEPAEKEK